MIKTNTLKSCASLLHFINKYFLFNIFYLLSNYFLTLFTCTYVHQNNIKYFGMSNHFRLYGFFLYNLSPIKKLIMYRTPSVYETSRLFCTGNKKI